jgi:anti-sigma28 factor (negative regulator of flagellin synthesis)
MKVNENAALIPPNSGVGKTNPGSNSTSVNPGANKVATDVVAGPAVNLDISLTAKLAEIKEELKTDKTATDKLLLDKIRAKIDSGEFEIDYQKIANGMLGDTIAALGSKVRSK